jgi:hypothetical protein
LQELERRHHDMGGPVLVRARELQHNVASTVEFESFVGNSGAADIAAQLSEFVALIHGAAHLGMETEPLFVDTALLRGLRIKAGGSVRRGTASTSKTEGEAARPRPFLCLPEVREVVEGESRHARD